MALLAMVMTISFSTQVAFALGHLNQDEDYSLNSGFAEDGMDSSNILIIPKEKRRTVLNIA